MNKYNIKKRIKKAPKRKRRALKHRFEEGLRSVEGGRGGEEEEEGKKVDEEKRGIREFWEMGFWGGGREGEERAGLQGGERGTKLDVHRRGMGRGPKHRLQRGEKRDCLNFT
jgi:hypothetical protein